MIICRFAFVRKQVDFKWECLKVKRVRVCFSTQIHKVASKMLNEMSKYVGEEKKEN